MKTRIKDFWFKLQSNEELLGYLWAISLIVIACISFFLGLMKESPAKTPDMVKVFQKQAIDYNYAQYDEKTGVWRWKTPQEAALSIVEHNYRAALAALPPSIPPRVPLLMQEKGMTPEPPEKLPEAFDTVPQLTDEAIPPKHNPKKNKK